MNRTPMRVAQLATGLVMAGTFTCASAQFERVEPPPVSRPGLPPPSTTTPSTTPFRIDDPAARVGPLATKPALIFTVDVRWLGGSAYRMEREITSRIEQAVKTLPGVQGVHSTVVGSRAQTQVMFDVKTDASTTASAVSNRVDQIRMRLPRDASKPLIAWHREPPTAP